MASFSKNKRGRLIAEKLNKKYYKKVEEEYSKKRIDSNNSTYSDWSEEKIKTCNEEIRRHIEQNIRDVVPRGLVPDTWSMSGGWYLTY